LNKYKGKNEKDVEQWFVCCNPLTKESDMTLLAKNIMITDFDKINENEPVEKAIEMILHGKVRDTGHRTISLMVINDFNQYVGVITMFDILYHLRPSFLNYGVDSQHIPWEGLLRQCVDEIRHKRVKQVMSSQLIGAAPDEHIMVVLDRMVKNKYRRLPVLENGRLVGIVYISDIYHHLFRKDE
jgi:CBS domain-containing protein